MASVTGDRAIDRACTESECAWRETQFTVLQQVLLDNNLMFRYQVEIRMLYWNALHDSIYCITMRHAELTSMTEQHATDKDAT